MILCNSYPPDVAAGWIMFATGLLDLLFLTAQHGAPDLHIFKLNRLDGLRILFQHGEVGIFTAFDAADQMVHFHGPCRAEGHRVQRLIDGDFFRFAQYAPGCRQAVHRAPAGEQWVDGG